MKEIRMTLRMMKTLPKGIELLNVSKRLYYMFNCINGYVYNGMFRDKLRDSHKYNFRYILDLKTDRLYVLTAKERKQYEKELREEEEYYNKHTG